MGTAGGYQVTCGKCARGKILDFLKTLLFDGCISLKELHSTLCVGPQKNLQDLPTALGR